MVGIRPMIGMRPLQFLGLGISLGLAIWILSPMLLGNVEPWDPSLPVWSVSWLVIGILGGLTRRARGVFLPVGYGLGQMLITIRSPFIGQFGALGWLFIGWYTLFACVLALGTAGLLVLGSRVWNLVRARCVGG